MSRSLDGDRTLAVDTRTVHRLAVWTARGHLRNGLNGWRDQPKKVNEGVFVRVQEILELEPNVQLRRAAQWVRRATHCA
jgi:hypothetical protein